MSLLGKISEQAEQSGGLGNKLMAGVGSGLASGAVGAGLNILFGGMMNRRAYNQQKKLQELQIKGSKELTDYNAQKELAMWDATNAGAQRKHLEDAGLSASLMYGGTGAGGATTGSGGGAMPSGDSGSAQLMAGVNAQSAMADIALKTAQAENIKADTDKKKEETTGVGLDNIYKEFQNSINETSKEDQLEAIKATADKLTGEANTAAVQGSINTATQHAQQLQIMAGAIGAVIQNEATKAGTAKTEAETKAIAESVAQKWQELKLKGEQNSIERFKAEIMANTPGIDQVIGGKIDNLFNAISEIDKVVDTNKYRRKMK